MQRLPAAAIARREVAITIDDGPDPEVTPAVLDMLDAHGAKATFFCIAERASRHPELCRAHRRTRPQRAEPQPAPFACVRLARHRAGSRARSARRRRALTRASGQAPQFFRAPAGLRNPLLDPVLHRLGLRLVSWTRRGFDTVQRDPARVLARLARALAAGDILLLHDGNAAPHAQRHAGRARACCPSCCIAAQRAGLRARDAARGLARSRARERTAHLRTLALIDAASAPYRRAGRFAWHFARGKLGMDPVFRHVLQPRVDPPERARARHRLRPGVAREPRCAPRAAPPSAARGLRTGPRRRSAHATPASS